MTNMKVLNLSSSYNQFYILPQKKEGFLKKILKKNFNKGSFVFIN